MSNHKKCKIGILGGTFNPIHNGHIAMAQNALEQFDLDRVLIMPSGNSYLKSNVLNAKHRVEMVKLAIQDIPQFELSLIEVNRKGNTYTADTLTDLCFNNPDTEYYFILGMDSLAYMENWYKPDIIFDKAVIICALRDDLQEHEFHKLKEHLEKKFHAKILMLKMPLIDISSTHIRENVKNGYSIGNYVNSKVDQYIKEEHLYAED